MTNSPQKIKPILFSTANVVKIINNTKTQTRRLLIPQPVDIRKSVFVSSGLETTHGYEIKVKYKPDDILWVRETFAEYRGTVIYRAGIIPEFVLKQYDYENIKWKPSIFMKKKYARLFLLIQEVRIEHLQDITHADAYREGFHSLSSVIDFKKLWDDLNRERGFSWQSNPWIWVITFKKTNRPKNFIK